MPKILSLSSNCLKFKTLQVYLYFYHERFKISHISRRKCSHIQKADHPNNRNPGNPQKSQLIAKRKLYNCIFLPHVEQSPKVKINFMDSLPSSLIIHKTDSTKKLMDIYTRIWLSWMCSRLKGYNTIQSNRTNNRSFWNTQQSWYSHVFLLLCFINEILVH